MKLLEDAVAAISKPSFLDFVAAVPDEDKSHILLIVLGFNEEARSDQRDACVRSLFNELLKRNMHRRIRDADDRDALYHANVMFNLYETSKGRFNEWQKSVLRCQSNPVDAPDDSPGVRRLAMELRELPHEMVWVPSNRVLARGRQTGRVSKTLSQKNLVERLTKEHGFTVEPSATTEEKSEGGVTSYELSRDGDDLGRNEYKIYLAKTYRAGKVCCRLFLII